MTVNGSSIESSIFESSRGTSRILESLVPDPLERISTSCGARCRTCPCRIAKMPIYGPCLSHDPKGLAAPPAPPKAETPGVPASRFLAGAKSKAKSKATSISDEEQAKIPCIFHRMPNGCMHGSNCKYSHEDPKNSSVPKSKPKGKDAPPKGKGGPFAKAMVAVVAAASLCKPTAGSGPEYSVEWAADTAAGRHLGFHQAALLEQVVPSSPFQSCLRATDNPNTFSTGGGPQPGVQTLSISMNCNNMPEANHYFLESCLVV